jgi:aerobic-type carbon monoxide dehydrogenase small subunit (CoxS/CutS family)
MTAMTYNVNGRAYQFDADPGMPLLWVIRDIIGLTGTKYGCGVEICKACTVWIDGSPEKRGLLHVWLTVVLGFMLRVRVDHRMRVRTRLG